MIKKIINCRVKMLLLPYLLVLLSSTTLYAEQEYMPDELDGTTKISAEELISLAETKPDLIVIDARISQDRTYGYIEGSISLPNIATDCDSLSRIVETFNTPTVYYCNGPKCGRSLLSIKIAQKCGYNNIYWYRGGFEDWKNNGYPILF